jgi:hypothetical protein
LGTIILFSGSARALLEGWQHHHPKCQSLQPEMRVEKLQRGAQKYALQQLDPEDFEVQGMEEAQLSPDQLELCLV